jgi:predicted ester cyclase
MTQDNLKATTQRIYDLMDQQNFTALRELTAPGFAAHVAGSPATDVEGWVLLGQKFYGGFPDGKFQIEHLLQDGDKVVMRGRWSGTHKGSFHGIAATCKRVEVTIICINRFAGGKLVEVWKEFDSLGMMQQLGAIPASPR